MKSLRPIVFIVGLILVVSLACVGLSNNEPTVAPQQPVVQQEQPTEVPPTEIPSTEAPVASSGPFFTEEFDSDPQWYYEVIKGNEKSDPETVSYEFDSSRMIFEIPEEALFAYYIYQGHTYDSVRLDIKVENRGVNTQQVSLVCSFSDDGWYEWAVQSDGRWELYAVSDGYHRMHNGASNFIKQGKDVNEYGMICDNNEISFFVNGEEPKGSPYTDRKYALRDGNVGFSISSLRAIPVLIEVDWFKISEP
ncbi:MAG: hypothetical protein HYZ21_05145 [Chloroflexi bacterium]|nr:hypothetical protein [Chloroflexota bacterium]